MKRRCSQQLCVCVWRRKSTDISGSLGCSALGCRPRLEAKCASGFKRDAARLDRRARSRPRANEQVRPKTNRSGGQPSRSEARRSRGRPKPQILLLLAACCPRAPLFVIITRARAPKLRRRRLVRVARRRRLSRRHRCQLRRRREQVHSSEWQAART